MSDPCTTSSVWTCESTSTSKSLIRSVFLPLTKLFDVKYVGQVSLIASENFSFHYNILTAKKLNLSCWDLSNFTGSILINQGTVFSNSYTYKPSYRSCRWEGFIKDLYSGDLAFIVSGTSKAKLWVRNDVIHIIDYTCCTPVSYNIRLVKEVYTYIRLDISTTVGTLGINLHYKELPSAIEKTLTDIKMYQPIRLSIGVLTGSTDIAYNIPNNIPENDVYYCPLICTSCILKVISYKCTGCVDGASLVGDECVCNTGKIWNNYGVRCEDYPPLCNSCSWDNSSLLCNSCKNNAYLKEYSCECITGYYENLSTKSCIPSSCKIDLYLYKLPSYNYTDTLLEVNNPCQVTDGITCRDLNGNKALYTKKLIILNDLGSLLSASYDISSTSSYTIGILQLTAGNLLLETFPTNNWSGSPDVSYVSTSITIDKVTSSNSFRLHGYLKFPLTGVYYIRLSCNSSGVVYFDFQKETWTFPRKGLSRAVYLAAHIYYYIMIEFSGSPLNKLTLKLNYSYNGEIYEFSPNMIYYADSNRISRWDISSCNTMLSTPKYKNDLRYCPLLCTACNLKLKSPATTDRVACTACVENAYINLDGICICINGYYSTSDAEICNRCPDNCVTCGIENGLVECKSCVENAEVKLGVCMCKSGYYLVYSSSISCNKCPDICSTCSIINDKVICDSCIPNSSLELGVCKCNSDYIQSTTFPIYCYRLLQRCTDSLEISGNLSCTSCVENAHIEEGKCVCDSGFYGSESQDDLCIKCAESCKDCSEINSEVICQSCTEGHYLSGISANKCLRCKDYCNVCEEIQGNIACKECIDTFILNEGDCQCDVEDYYLLDNKCIVKLFEVSYLSEINQIKLYFSKRLMTDLVLSDLDISYPAEIDTTLLSISLEAIEYHYSYSVYFSYKFEICKDIIIQITFSDAIVDRQLMKLVINPVSINLSLLTHLEDTCDSLCRRCEGYICAECSDYAYMKGVECVCYSESNIDGTCKAECPENMKLDTILKSCLPCDETCISNPSDENDLPTESEINNKPTEYTDTEIEEAEMYSNISSGMSNTAIYTSLAIGSTCSGLDNAWSLMNTIQIFTYLPLINVELPLSLRKFLISQDDSQKVAKKLDGYIPKGPAPNEVVLKFGLDTGSFLFNSAKPILIISALLIANIILYLTNKVSKGKIKVLSGKILGFFCYGAYLRFFIQKYMDLGILVLLQVITVIFI